MQLLYDVVAHLEVTVEYRPLDRHDGEYRDDLRRIRLREGMSPRLERWTFAHELGHAIHGHQLASCGTPDLKQEREADEWAALLLIRLPAYRESELARDGHVPSMAHDLGVVSRGVVAFQRTLARIGNDVYLKPRHGVGQWAARLAAA